VRSLVEPAETDHRGSGCEGRVDPERSFEQGDGLANALLGVLVTQRERAQIKVPGVEALGRFASGTFNLGLAEPWLDRPDNTAGDLVLQFENVVKGTIETVGPDMRASCRVDQLPGDAHAVAGFAQAAFEHVAHAQFAPDLAQIRRFALVGKARIPGDDRIAAQIGERQLRDRRFVGRRQRRWGWRFGGAPRHESGRPAPAG
jgi:hypothetical protein